MKFYYDLHIHTGLSPCAEDDMSPNNIIQMVKLKGLDLVAITDHNSIGNVKSCLEVGRRHDVLVIPGMELQTKEEVHLLCLFRSLDDAQVFEDRIDPLRMRIPNKPDRFGHQYLYNESDDVVGEYPWNLLTSIDIGIEEAVKLVTRRGGVVIPCHLDRKANSILYTLGFLPQEPEFKVVELSTSAKEKPVGLDEKHEIIQNSDAHTLGDLSEPVHYMDLEALTLDHIFAYLGGETI